MTLHLIECAVDLRDLHLWAGTRRLGSTGTGFDEGLVLHHLLGEAFGPGILQPFRLMVAPRARTATLYAYASEDAEALCDRLLRHGTPGQVSVVPPDRLRSMPRPPESWHVGLRLGFDLKLRPVVRLHASFKGVTADGAKVSLAKGAELDVFLSRALKGESVDREATYLDWLGRQLEPAATMERETTRLVSFARTKVQRNGRRIEGPDAIFHGTLTVSDPAAFADLLRGGVGRHRTYGYGMLLLRPPQRRSA
jgi:CRISPR system Cascade subunit CasE